MGRLFLVSIRYGYLDLADSNLYKYLVPLANFPRTTLTTYNANYLVRFTLDTSHRRMVS